MTATLTLDFAQADLLSHLDAMDEAQLDGLAFGVIGIDRNGVVNRYNATESKLAGLAPSRALTHPLFTVVAPCMNNFMVAQQFEDSAAAGSALDHTLDYVLTLRMRPVKVKLRLLAPVGIGQRYVLVLRPS